MMGTGVLDSPGVDMSSTQEGMEMGVDRFEL